MTQWDVTTAEGRIALERFLMQRTGYIEVEIGWVFTPEGMVALKRWAAEKKGIVLQSCVLMGGDEAYSEVYWEDSLGGYRLNEKAEDEPTAVALALARALEEMGYGE